MERGKIVLLNRKIKSDGKIFKHEIIVCEHTQRHHVLKPLDTFGEQYCPKGPHFVYHNFIYIK